MWITSRWPTDKNGCVRKYGADRFAYIHLDIIELCGLCASLAFAEMLARLPRRRAPCAGYQLDKVQRGNQPDDFKPMPGIGKGVEEIRVSEPSGAYRVIYVARRVEAVYVLHVFHKKSQVTPKKDLEIAKRRIGQLLGGRI
jgi:phage-related protein